MCVALQHYGYVEYSLPADALKCKEGMDKVEMEQRPDFRSLQVLLIYISVASALPDAYHHYRLDAVIVLYCAACCDLQAHTAHAL